MRKTLFVITCLSIAALCHAAVAGDTREEALAKFSKLQAERMRQGLQPLSLLDLVNMYSEADRKKILEDTVRNNGIYFDIAGRWDLIDDPTTALGWAYHDREPFDRKIVDTLERTFGASQDDDQRLRIAFLLYRYKREAGAEYLLKLLERDDVDVAVAVVLASNREQKAMAGIRKVFEARTPGSELIYALGRWGSEASPLLQAGFLASRGSPVDYLRAFTMAQHRVDGPAIERIRQMFERGQGVTRADAASALIRLEPGNRKPLEYLSSKLEDWRAVPEGELFSVVRALSREDSLQARARFTEIVESYAIAQQPTYLQPAQIEAAAGLAEKGGEKEKLLVVQMLRKAVKENISDKRDVYTIAQAIHDSRLPNSDAILNELMGQGFTAQVRGMRELRTLPVKFLPVLSQPFAGKLYWVE